MSKTFKYQNVISKLLLLLLLWTNYTIIYILEWISIFGNDIRVYMQ